jgi:transposase
MLRAALNALASVAPQWVQANIPLEWVKRYGTRAEESRFPDADAERARFFDAVGEDGSRLLDRLWAEHTPTWMRQLPAVEALRIVWVQSFEVVDGAVRQRAKDNRPPSARQIESPYDTEARFARKREMTWVGYKVHVTEACDEDAPHVITNIHTDDALKGDNDALPDIHEELSVVELLPRRHLVDTGYVEAKRLVESERDYGVELYGPTPGNRRWQSQQGKGFDISQFEIDWEREVVTCPEGKTSSTWKPGHDTRGNEFLNVVFAKSECSICRSRPDCTTAKTQRRTINVKPQPLHEALQSARTREQSKEFKQAYKKRAGIEGTISQGVRAFGLRRSRYIGMAKTRLQHLATAAAMNLVRAYAWLIGEPHEGTRKSVFVRVMEPLAATL